MVVSCSSESVLYADGLLMTFQVFEFPGGAIQWARYRNNVKDYLSIEEEAFGSSLNSQRSQMTLGTLRIKSSGLRAPHWHFNANEHGYLVQVKPVYPCSVLKHYAMYPQAIISVVAKPT